MSLMEWIMERLTLKEFISLVIGTAYFVSGLLFENFWIKLVCLVFAIIFYLLALVENK